MIADTFLSVSTSSQIVLPEVLRGIHSYSNPIQTRVKDNYLFLQSASPAHCTLLRCEGGWSAMLRVPATRSDEQWSMTLLEEQKVLVHPGHLFDTGNEPYLVLSLLPTPTVFREAVQRIARFFAAFSQ
jgi:aspartate/methionine/tyrosine aminotransferase